MSAVAPRSDHSRTAEPLVTSKFRLAGLFAGIGGFELAARHEGGQAELLCEIDAGAQAVLKSRFSEVPIAQDVIRLKALPSTIDVLAAGFPCQNLSAAGNKVGISGDQSSLVSHVFRLLRKRKVRWLVLENVYFMLQVDGGRAIRQIVDELEALGYAWAYRVVDSFFFGLPQRRRRVYLVASRTDDPRSVLFADNVAAPKLSMSRRPPIGFYWTEGLGGIGFAPLAVPPLKGGSSIGIPSPPAILFPRNYVGSPDIRDAERLQGFPIDWTSPAEDVGRASMRWRLVGNSVTVPVARWVFSRLNRPGTPLSYKEVAIAEGRAWPLSAWGSKTGRFAVEGLSESPLAISNTRIDKFLQFPTKPLSERATAGFLERARRSRLKYPPEFLTSVEAHLSECRSR